MFEKVHWMCPLLSVFDMPESLTFYCDILGFEMKQSAGPEGDMGWAWLTLGDIDLMLNTQYELPDKPLHMDEMRKVAHGDTILYFGCPELDLLYHRLKLRGVEVSEPYNTGYGFRAIDLKDPDGYAIVFQWQIG